MRVRFRTFRAQVLALFLLVTGAIQLATLAIVARIQDRQARTLVTADLRQAAREFEKEIRRGNLEYFHRGNALSHDRAMRDAFTATTHQETIASALASFRARVDAGLVALLDPEGTLVAETRRGESAAAVYRTLYDTAENDENERSAGYAFLDGKVYSLVTVPLRAPTPVAWIVIGFPLDEPFLAQLKETTSVAISLRRGGRQVASTGAPPGELLTETVALPLLGGERAEMLLQRSIDEELQPARWLQRWLLWTGAGGIAAAAIAALIFARRLSAPVQQLAAHTRHVAAGDYRRRLRLDRDDELGQLAHAFNSMSAGLEERDRVRDLLDKNVSPEVAAQLLRDGAALGGEVREVTILFADLRGFTTMSEMFTPQELLALLNRYLDRMSTEIERHGGVIDKYIGDAIMALFGAPVAQGDAADRAVAAALGMERALGTLNRELVSEGRAPLGLGVGINTARVVAGNIGSQRRLNYSVIGDGVNVASRLQALTRTDEYRTNIITSAATLAAVRRRDAVAARPLGTVPVKGRAEPVEIYAIG